MKMSYILTMMFTLLLPFMAMGQAGSLDENFGGDGTVTTTLNFNAN